MEGGDYSDMEGGDYSDMEGGVGITVIWRVGRGLQ